MTPPHRRISRVAALVLVAFALPGCTSGLAAHAGTPFTECLGEAGVPIGETASWTREQEREQLSDPEALACILSDLPADERRKVLGWAFPEVAADARVDEQAPVADAVAGFLEGASPGDAEAIADAGELLVALGMTGAEPEGVRHALAFELHRDAGGPLYDAWREGLDLEDAFSARSRFVAEQLDLGGALAEFYTETSGALLEAQHAAAD